MWNYGKEKQRKMRDDRLAEAAMEGHLFFGCQGRSTVPTVGRSATFRRVSQILSKDLWYDSARTKRAESRTAGPSPSPRNSYTVTWGREARSGDNGSARAVGSERPGPSSLRVALSVPPPTSGHRMVVAPLLNSQLLTLNGGGFTGPGPAANHTERGFFVDPENGQKKAAPDGEPPNQAFDLLLQFGLTLTATCSE
jgi:hypothetical protein